MLGSHFWGPLQIQDLLDAIAIPETDLAGELDEDPTSSRRLNIGNNWNRFWSIIYQHCNPLVELIKDESQDPSNASGTRASRAGYVEPTWILQLAHQTVKSFLEDPSAGNRILIDPVEVERLVLNESYGYLDIVLPKHNAAYLPLQSLFAGSFGGTDFLPSQSLITSSFGGAL